MKGLSNNYNKVFSFVKIIFLLIAILYSINFVFWGGGFGLVDGSFWVNKTESYKDIFLNVFTVYLEKVWLDIFARTVVSCRFLSWFCVTIAMVIPFVCLQDKKKAWKNISFLSIGFLLCRTAGNFDYDSTTLLMLSILTVLLIKYIQSRNKWYVLFLSLFCALASCARFPNIMVVPLIGSILGYVSKQNRKEWRLVLLENSCFVFLFVIFYAAILYLLTGEANLWGYAVDGIVNNKVGGTHTIANVLKNYKSSWLVTLGYFSNIVIAYFILMLFSGKITARFKVSVLGILLVELVTFSLLFLLLKDTIYIDYIYDAVYGLLFVALSAYLFYISNNTQEKLFYFIFISFCVIGIAGSDTGLIKLIHYAGIMTPILLCKMKLAQLFNKRFNNVILFTFVVFSVYARSNNMRFHKVYLRDNKYLSHVLLTEEEKVVYERLLKDVRVYGNNGNNVFYGQIYGNLMYSLTNEKPPYFCSYWMYKDDFNELGIIIDLMMSDNRKVLFDYTKSDISYFKKHHLKLIATTKDCNIYKK